MTTRFPTNRARAWATGQDWNPARRARKAWAASEWSRMSGADIAWHLAGWALCLGCALVVAVAYALAVALWPRQMCVLTAAAILGGGWYWVGFWHGNRAGDGRRDGREYEHHQWKAIADSDYRAALAEAGPVTGPTPITDVEPPEWVTNPPYLADEVSA
jgi:hypothetical protein